MLSVCVHKYASQAESFDRETFWGRGWQCPTLMIAIDQSLIFKINTERSAHEATGGDAREDETWHEVESQRHFLVDAWRAFHVYEFASHAEEL